jgi:CRISPR-associated protein Csb2
MSRFLLFEIRLHDARWHGADEWPPSPFRLFQALVAAAACGATIGSPEREALEALERAPAPIVAVPRSRPGQAVKLYVPNNDLDTVGGDPARIGSIRAPKRVQPMLFEAPGVFLVAWPVERLAETELATIGRIAARLYQFGRGVDMACARAEVVTVETLEERLARHAGPVHRPSGGRKGATLRCPGNGSLQSLIIRHQGFADRLKVSGQLRQAPPARFRMVAYDCPPTRVLFELAAPPDSGRPFRPWPLERCAELAARLRDLAVARLLHDATSARAAQVERLLIGRGAGEADKPQRVRIVPLPSIGMPHTDPSIRRVLVEVPPDCPIPAADVAWAFSGLDLGVDPDTGEVVDHRAATLVRSDDTAMLRHYRPGRHAERDAATVWRTVTPVALPIRRAAGRVGGAARCEREGAAAAAVNDALRHAGLRRAEVVRLQREPFSARGARAEAFSAGSRFDAARLWHLEIALKEPVRAPLVIGDGRFVGLGLMAPARDELQPRRWRLAVETAQPIPTTDALSFAEAVRAALMGRWRVDHGDALPSWLSGHDASGGVLRAGAPAHLFIVPYDADRDGRIDAVEIIVPPGASEREARDVGRLVSSLHVVVRNGVRAATVVAVTAAVPAQGRVWRSRTPYLLTRFPKGGDLESVVAADLIRECRRADLPTPRIEVLHQAPAGWTVRREAPQFDRCGWLATLAFSVAVEGPFCLGRHRHFGMGAFEGVE